MGPLTGLATITTALLVLTVVAAVVVLGLTAWAVADLRRTRVATAPVTEAPAAAATAGSRTRHLRAVGSH